MTSKELMRLTLLQLIEYFYMYPECFMLEDPELSTSEKAYHQTNIIFQSKSDPDTAKRSIVINWNDIAKTLQCSIYFKEIPMNGPSGLKPDAHTSVQMEWKHLNVSYRLFRKLRKAMLNRLKDNEYNEFLSKLHSVFPGTFDEYIFGKPK